MDGPSGQNLGSVSPGLSDLPGTTHLHRFCLPILPSPHHPFGELRFAPVLTDAEPITQILAHTGEPSSPLLIHHARGPPQTESDIGFVGGESEEAARDAFHEDLDQSSGVDPADPEPIPEDDLDQRWDARLLGPSGPARGAPGVSKQPLPTAQDPPHLPFFYPS
jgi:hypothetical protein